MGKLVLGLDIGIASVGWGILDIENDKIVDCGVRIFDEGTAAGNLVRREKRGNRRLKRRKQLRLEDIRKYLIDEKVIKNQDFKLLDNPYAVRVKGIREKLSNEELATAILSIARRRGVGFKIVEEDDIKDQKVTSDNSKENEKKDFTFNANDSQSTKKILGVNEKILRDKNFYICELLNEKLLNGESIRGFENCFDGESYKKELKQLLEVQKTSKEFNDKIFELIFRQRQYFEGPGSEKSPTPYGRFFVQNGVLKKVDLIEKMRGRCSVFPVELRAPKMSYKADLFNLLNDLNNLTIPGVEISAEIKQNIINNYINIKSKITPNQLAKLLGVKLELISGFRINKSGQPILTEFKGYKIIMDAVNKNDLSKVIYENKDYLDKIIEILTRAKGLEERKEEIININRDVFTENDLNILSNLTGIREYHALSEKAIDLLIPELMESNNNQMQILTNLGLRRNSKDAYIGLSNIPSDKQSILSPVARKSQNEAIKIVNAIRKRYGELESIIIEMPRDKNSDDQRNRINDNQKKGELLNKETEELVKGINVQLNGKLRQKLRLYKEQDGRCLYSGRPIDLRTLILDPLAFEVDHILPISISLDDSMSNKVLSYKIENSRKSNRSPFQYFSSGEAQGWSFPEFEEYCISLRNKKLITRRKLEYLLEMKDINKFDNMKEFINRNLVDTRYASKSILNNLSDYFGVNNIETKVHTIRGSITSVFRKITGIDKDRDESYHHHAVDALIIAGLKKSNYFNKIFKFKINRDGLISSKDTGEIINTDNEHEFFDEELIKFVKTLRNAKISKNNETYTASSKSLFVNISHKIDKKPNRQFTNETIYGVRQFDGIDYRMGTFKDIYSNEGLKVAKIIRDNDDDKLMIKRVDNKSYQLLKDIVKEYFINDKVNPFEEFRKQHGYIRKYSKKGNGPIIKSLRYIYEKLGNHVNITDKYIKNSDSTRVVLLKVSPYRTDFYVNSEGLYKFVTVRYSDIIKRDNYYEINKEVYLKNLSNKGITKNYKFLFSLHKNEYFTYTNKSNEINNIIFRFLGTRSDNTNNIEYKNIDIPKDEKRLSFTVGKKISSIEKFHVDVLGKIYKVSKEVLHFKL